jgi:hypothetical protein
VDDLLADPDLANPLLEPNFFIDFKRLSELVLNVEDSSLLILKRCSQEDCFLSALLRQICREVGYKEPAPLCGALSFQYFQALMGMDIIMTPQTQASELLALPDLYHELDHFVLFRRRTEFEVPLLGLIHKYFTDAIRKGKQQGLPKASLEVIRDNHALWTGAWHVEFACDMVATYWCGPAYGLANLRLSATRGDPYQDGTTHPADDARRAGIECILKLAGEAKAAGEIDTLWRDLKRLSPSAQPAGYTKRYSTRLLEKMAKCIYEASESRLSAVCGSTTSRKCLCLPHRVGRLESVPRRRGRISDIRVVGDREPQEAVAAGIRRFGDEATERGFTVRALGHSIFTEADSLEDLRRNARTPRHFGRAGRDLGNPLRPARQIPTHKPSARYDQTLRAQ